MKKIWGAINVGQFFVTRPTDFASKPSRFDCQICREDVVVTTNICDFRGSKHLPCDQRPGLETPSWEVLDYEGNAMREKIMRAPLVVRDREYPFSEELIVDETGAVDPNLGVMAKVSSLIASGGSYELVYQLWAQFTLSAVRVNVDVTWSHDAVLVSMYNCPVLSM